MRRNREEVIGRLSDDLDGCARRIQDACSYSTMMIWADDLNNIRAGPPDRLVHVPSYAIIGTYGLGIALHDIADDLRAERVERALSWTEESRLPIPEDGRGKPTMK